MGLKPIDTAILAETAAAIPPALAAWDGVIDDVVIRAITAQDTLDDHLALVRAARPA